MRSVTDLKKRRKEGVIKSTKKANVLRRELSQQSRLNSAVRIITQLRGLHMFLLSMPMWKSKMQINNAVSGPRRLLMQIHSAVLPIGKGRTTTIESAAMLQPIGRRAVISGTRCRNSDQ